MVWLVMFRMFFSLLFDILSLIVCFLLMLWLNREGWVMNLKVFGFVKIGWDSSGINLVIWLLLIVVVLMKLLFGVVIKKKLLIVGLLFFVVVVGCVFYKGWVMFLMCFVIVFVVLRLYFGGGINRLKIRF